MSNFPIEHVLQNVGAHGIPNILRAKSMYRKIFWLLVLFGGLGAFTYHCVKNLQNYLDHNVTVNVDIVYEPMLAFPAVTICNLNPVKESVLYKFPELDNILRPQQNNGAIASENEPQSSDMAIRQNGTTMVVDPSAPAATDTNRNCIQVSCVAISVLQISSCENSWQLLNFLFKIYFLTMEKKKFGPKALSADFSKSR